MDYAKLLQAQIDIMRGLFDTIEKENRDYTEDERAKYDAAKAEFDRLKGFKDWADKLAAMNDQIPKAEPAPATEPASVAKAKSTAASAGKDLKNTKPYESVGSMLIDVVAHTVKGDSGATERLYNANLNTGTGSEGGFLIPEDFVGSMLERADEQSELFSRTTQLPLKGNTANIPAVDETSRADGSRYGGIQVFWVNEGSEATYKQPKFRNLDLKLKKIMGLVSVTEEMLEDAPLLSSWLNTAFPAEMAFTLDQAIFNGDGNGKPLGILHANNGALIVVAKEGGQTADTIVYENIVKMWARMPARRASRAVWYVTQQVMEQLPFMKLDVGTGGSAVFLPPGGASGAPYGTLFGRPVISIEQANTLGDQGDIVLADMSDYISVVKGGLKTAQSIHVNFNKDITAFRFTRRINGAPYTRTALASRALAAFTTSPYITLAARA